MSYTVNWDWVVLMLKCHSVSRYCQILHVCSCTIWTKKPKTKKKSLHFPACFGARHACDVTISIYTATGKNFFLHCCIVTNGAGAKRGEKASSRSNIYNILTPIGGCKKNQNKTAPIRVKCEKTAQSEHSRLNPPRREKKDKPNTDVSGFLHRKRFKAPIRKIRRHSAVYTVHAAPKKKKMLGKLTIWRPSLCSLSFK